MTVLIRSRKKTSNAAVEVVKQLDSFPKVNKDDYIERSNVGGIGLYFPSFKFIKQYNLCLWHDIMPLQALILNLFSVSIIAYTIIVLIILFEIKYYYGSDVAFQFVPDTDFNAKLRVNLDITIAMPCHSKNLFPSMCNHHFKA